MPKCTDGPMLIGKVGRRVVEAAFDGGDIASDGGVMLLKQVDERIGLTRAAARAFADKRRAASVRHGIQSLLAQRVYGLCCGWEDVTDHNTLRRDLALQTAVGRAEELGSAPTLSRLETSATSEHAVALNEVLVDQLIASRNAVPAQLVLDVDATHVPLYVFCGQDMLACVLRPSWRDPASVFRRWSSSLPGGFASAGRRCG